MNENRERRLKVYGQSNGYNYKDVPTILLKGKWLKVAGFDINDDIIVKIEKGSLQIQKANLCREI